MSIDVRAAGAACWRQRVLAAVLLAVVAGSATVGVWAAPKTYSATATLAAPAASGVTADEGELDAMRAALAALTDSGSVVAATRQRVGVLRTAAQIRDGVTGHWSRGTVLVRVTVRDADPRVAARLANTVVAVLVAERAPGGTDRATATGDLEVGVVDLAVVPTTYDDPDLPLVAGLAAVAALALVVAAVVVRDRRTHTVDDAVTAEAAAAAPLLAHLRAPADLAALPTLQPGTAAAGDFTNLRATLERQAAGRGPVVLVVAGVGAGDLTVWVGANLAVALAIASAGRGRRVLLVDGRMRERTGRPLAPEPDTVGLYDVLAGAPIDDATSPGPVAGLDVCPPAPGATSRWRSCSAAGSPAW